jgi:O-antigen/teichoic acid export membrane protein
MTLAAQDRQQAFPAISAAVLALNVSLNLILIPAMSLRGAAIAMAVSQLVLTALMLRLVAEVTASFSFLRIFGACAAGSAMMALVAVTLGSGLLSLFISAVLYAVVFFAIEWRLHRDDLLLFSRALGRRGGVDAARITNGHDESAALDLG